MNQRFCQIPLGFIFSMKPSFALCMHQHTAIRTIMMSTARAEQAHIPLASRRWLDSGHLYPQQGQRLFRSAHVDTSERVPHTLLVVLRTGDELLPDVLCSDPILSYNSRLCLRRPRVEARGIPLIELARCDIAHALHELVQHTQSQRACNRQNTATHLRGKRDHAHAQTRDLDYGITSTWAVSQQVVSKSMDRTLE